MNYSALRFTVVLLVAVLSLGAIHDAEPQGIDGVWSGVDTNDEFSSTWAIKLTTNGFGAVYGGGENIGIPGTFTYTLLEDHITYLTNGTPPLTGTLLYDASADILIYQARANAAEDLQQSRGPVLLHRSTNERGNAMLGSIIGATNYSDLLKKLGGFLDTLTNRVNSTSERSDALKEAGQGGATNRSQTVHLETNSTSSTAGLGH